MNMQQLANILETLMIVSFGVSWPLSIKRSWTSRSTKGKSILFLCFIAFGYGCGIASKIVSGNRSLAFWFYFPNMLMVCTDIALYFRNRHLEKSGNGNI